MKRTLITLALEISAILLLHTIFLWLLAEKNVVAVIFSAGLDTPLPSLALAGGFVLVRLMAIVLLPGIILSRLGIVAFEYFRLHRIPVEAKASPRQSAQEESNMP